MFQPPRIERSLDGGAYYTFSHKKCFEARDLFLNCLDKTSMFR